MSQTIVVLGTGFSGLTAAIAARKQNPSATIIAIGDEPAPTYNRTMLSKTPLHHAAAAIPAVQDASLFAAQNITLLRGKTATWLNITENHVTLHDNTTIPFDTCVYALGATPNIPPIPGIDYPGIILVRKNTDRLAVRRAMLQCKHVVVLGGGVVGIEMAWELHQSGVSVTVLESAPHLLPRLTDPTSASRLQSILTQAGLRIVTDATATSITGDHAVSGVTTADGTHYPSDGLMLLSTGERPNTALAAGASLAVDHGVVVNASMQTSAPHVFACGDCTAFDGTIRMTWPDAYHQGQTAGENAAGGSATYTPKDTPVFLNVAGITFCCVGGTGSILQSKREVSVHG